MSTRREESFQPKDLGWLVPCDKHRDEESLEYDRATAHYFANRPQRLISNPRKHRPSDDDRRGRRR
ncbi:hypothetical protein CFBP6625_02770 [Agrobacterium tumefaciens]|nr:hypothetical protein CFBP6625_02770 [Agrobacterium tumefaciens]